MPETAVWTEEMEHSFLILLLPAFSITQTPPQKLYETRAAISLKNFTVPYLNYSNAFACVQTAVSIPKSVNFKSHSVSLGCQIDY